MPRKGQTIIRHRQSNLIYDEQFVAHLEDLHWNKGLKSSQIAEALGMRKEQVWALMERYAISFSDRVYRLPGFSGWDFRSDNMENPQW